MPKSKQRKSKSQVETDLALETLKFFKERISVAKNAL